MNAHTAIRVDAAPRRLLSVADLSRMVETGIIAENEHVELIDGELFTMNAKKFAHEFIKSSLVRLFIRSSTDDIFVGIEASLRLDTHTLVEPDILVCRKDKLTASPEGYIGVPAKDVLLLVEIADSTLRKDRTVKARLYARHEVPEYWIVDTRRRLIWRHLDPRGSTYAATDKIARDETVSPAAPDLGGLPVRLAEFA